MMEPAEKQMLADVHSALVGNAALGNKGLVPRVAELETKTKQYDLKFYALSALGTAALVILELFEYAKHLN